MKHQFCLNKVFYNLKSNMFFIALFMYLFTCILSTSSYINIPYVNVMIKGCRYFSYLLSSALILIKYKEVIPDLLEKLRSRKFADIKNYLYVFCFLILVLAITLCTKDMLLITTCIILFSAKDEKFEKVIKFIMWILIISTVFIMFSAKIEFISNLYYTRADSNIVRMSFGFLYPTYLSTNIFIITLLFILLKKGLSYFEYFVLFIIDFLAFCITDSKMAFGFICLLLLLFYCLKKNEFAIFSESNCVKNIAIYLPVLILIISLIITFMYNNEGIMSLVNKMLTNRIALAHNAIQKYGVSIFGQQIEWIGFGGSTNTDALLESYNFVDNGYIKVLLDYGVIFIAIYTLLLMKLNKILYLEKKYIFLFVLCCLEIYCFIEPDLIDIKTNPFILYFITNYSLFLKLKHKKGNMEEDKSELRN